MVKVELRVKLEDYLRDHDDFREFLKNNETWSNIKDTSQIDIRPWVENYPLSIIVGRENELMAAKKLIYDTVRIVHSMEKDYRELLWLEIIIEKSKKHNRNFIKKRENELLKEGMDWVESHHQIAEELISKKPRILENIFADYPLSLLDLKIDWNRISENVIAELPPLPILYFLGPVGSGKSLMQKQLAASYMQLAKRCGIKGFDFVAVRDPKNNEAAEILMLPGGHGKKLIEDYDITVETKEKRKKSLVKLGMAGVYGVIGYFIATFGYKFVSEPWGSYGVQPLWDLWMWIEREWHWGALSAGAYVAYKLGKPYLKNATRPWSKRPELLSSSTESPPVYAGSDNETGSSGLVKLIGEYKRDIHIAPQDCFEHKPEILSGISKPILVEQTGELPKNVQSLLTEIVQESRIEVAGKGQWLRPFYAILFMGSNTHKDQDVIHPIKDRSDHFASRYIGNEVSVAGSERTAIERHFKFFLKSIINETKKAVEFSEEAVEEAIVRSTVLSEDVNSLYINRRYLNGLVAALGIAEANAEKFVTKAHLMQAFNEVKSIQERQLERVISEHYKNYTPSTGNTMVGCAKIVPLLSDESLITETEHAGIKKEMAEDYGVGYVARITARAKKTAGIEVIAPQHWDKNVVEHYEQFMNSLYIFSGKGAWVDLTQIINPDETITAGMYFALKSLFNGIPMNHNQFYIAGLKNEKEFKHVPHINKRIMNSGIKGICYVTKHDLDERLVKSYYKGIEFLEIKT